MYTHMESIQKYKVTVTDMYNDVFELSFSKQQYPDLRSLIEHSYPEEFGECRGRGLCGTCHVKVTSGSLYDSLDSTERETLKKLHNADTSSRLACRIMLNENSNNRTFKIISQQ